MTGRRVTVSKQRSSAGRPHTVGIGDVGWNDELTPFSSHSPEPPLAKQPPLELHSAPIGKTLRCKAIALDARAALEYAQGKSRETHGLFLGEDAVIHPGWIAEQPIHWLHHSFDYGPAIHT